MTLDKNRETPTQRYQVTLNTMLDEHEHDELLDGEEESEEEGMDDDLGSPIADDAEDDMM